METLIGVLCTLLSTLVGIYFTRYYYLKSNPEKKSVGPVLAEGLCQRTH